MGVGRKVELAEEDVYHVGDVCNEHKNSEYTTHTHCKANANPTKRPASSSTLSSTISLSFSFPPPVPPNILLMDLPEGEALMFSAFLLGDDISLVAADTEIRLGGLDAGDKG